jgi:hypothetical protein
LRPSFNLARQVAKNVVSNVERQASTASIEATPAWRLRGSTDFIWLGDYSGSGWRAKLVADFDDRYWQRLLAQRVAKVADQA